MPDHRTCPILLGAALAALSVLSSVRAEAHAAHAGQAALDYAFKFASAIKSDAKDRSKAQAGVVLDYASIDETDAALAHADLIEGWRRATVYADLATHLAQSGQSEKARATLAKAEHLRTSLDGWEGPRVSAHVAQALADLGDIDRSKDISASLVAEDTRQYLGRTAATVAMGHAARGEFSQAMQRLRELDDHDDFEITWWRTAGYLGIARQTKLNGEQRREALDAARHSADKIAGWKQAEALESIAEEYRLGSDLPAARAALERAETTVRPLPESLSIKAPLLSNLARDWAKLGERARARELLQLAEKAVPKSLAIDQPAIWANVASSYLTLGEQTQAWTLYERALTSAQGLENSRPRALAVVEILRSIGRADQALTVPLHARLDALFAGLGDPW